MDIRYERLYEPGQAAVYPPPEIQPWEMLERWGAPPERPAQPSEGRPWISPGPPPGPTGWITTGEEPSPTPRWAVVCLVVGSVLVCVAGAVLTGVAFG